MIVSIVVSVYNEENVLSLFYTEIIKVLNENTFDYELIFVNDGSIDNSKNILNGFASENPKVKTLHLSTNFGHESAMIAGIDYATGNAIICMDSDLQHPPTEIPKMIECFQRQKMDIINMVNTNTNKKVGSEFFYYFLNKISSHKITNNASDFFLISDRIAQILRKDFRERVRFLRGFIQIIGFNKTTLTFNVQKRRSGKSINAFG